jgi:hypothetical protein
LRLVD